MQASNMDREVWPGKPYPRGASFDGSGVNFAVFSSVASRVEVCFFDARDPNRETGRVDLPRVTDHVWHGYVPGLPAGTLYGLRVHGPYAPEQGHRCNPAKLLVDPYARAIFGSIDWNAPVHGYTLGHADGDLARDDRDSMPGMPRAVVVDERFDWGEGDKRPEIPWRKTVIYEAHVKGLTMRHPGVPEAQRGTFAGLCSPVMLEHFHQLGVTAVELLPVHEAADDSFLEAKNLSNYWGYSTLGYFAPEQRFSSTKGPGDGVREFKQMVKTLHAAGIEVILDVVFNHTCEGNHLGPTLSLKGIDNVAYYWLMPDPRYNLDFTGCGNAINAALPASARLIADSLRYWAEVMHVDGFRFDLATVLGRQDRGEFRFDAPIFQIINQDPTLQRIKLIAEPWDTGSGGYQVGNFPAPWREWNGKYRDALRRFWKGDDNLAAEVGHRLAGSADLYQLAGRRPQAGVNFVTCHDGFTLQDLVSYSRKHNEQNGERNKDGADDNQSWNCGVEGETDDPEIVVLREREKRNLLTTLMVSQGVPMLCAGDEVGKTQQGNNNAYCQDNALSYVDWHLDPRRQALLQFTARLIHFRHQQPVLQRRQFLRGAHIWDSEFKDLTWYRPDGTEMGAQDWQMPFTRSLMYCLGGDAIPSVDEFGQRVVARSLLVLINAHHGPMTFTLPDAGEGSAWELAINTAEDAAAPEVLQAGQTRLLIPRSMAVLRQVPTAR
jgi:isoamylase